MSGFEHWVWRLRRHFCRAGAITGFTLWAVVALFTMTGPALLSACSATGATTELTTSNDDTVQRRRARVRLELAASYFQDGKNTIALDEIKQVMQIDPRFSDAFNLAGLIYQALAQPDLAAQHFERAIALNPRNGSAMHNLGWLECQQKKFERAERYFNRALALPGYTDRAKTMMTEGICLARAGDTQKAIIFLHQSYTIDNKNPVTAYNLSQLLLDSGRPALALPFIRGLNNSDLANAQSLWLGIRIERRLGNTLAAQQLGDQLHKRFADSREASLYDRRAFDESK